MEIKRRKAIVKIPKNCQWVCIRLATWYNPEKIQGTLAETKYIYVDDHTSPYYLYLFVYGKSLSDLLHILRMSNIAFEDGSWGSLNDNDMELVKKNIYNERNTSDNVVVKYDTIKDFIKFPCVVYVYSNSLYKDWTVVALDVINNNKELAIMLNFDGLGIVMDHISIDNVIFIDNKTIQGVSFYTLEKI